MKLFATCGFGIESVLKDELIALGMENVKAEDARVFFDGEIREVVRANLWLRTADRVFCQLAVFKATTFEELFAGLREADISQWLPRDASIVVTGKTALSKLVSIRDVQAVGKKAKHKRHKHAYRRVVTKPRKRIRRFFAPGQVNAGRRRADHRHRQRPPVAFKH